VAAAIIPLAKRMVVCDDVVGGPSGKPTIVGIWNRLRLPAGASFPYTLGKLCVYVYWRGGLGQVRSHIEVVNAMTGAILVRTSDFTLSFPTRSWTVHGRYLLPDVEFPGPGEYFVEMFCEGVFVEDQSIEVVP